MRYSAAVVRDPFVGWIAAGDIVVFPIALHWIRLPLKDRDVRDS
jgi:hypothetical protein